MQRIYLPRASFSDQLILSERQIYHQLTRVLRGRVWNKVIFFDGKKLEDNLYEIIDINKNEVKLQKKEIINKSEEQEINLYQSLPNKLNKIEYILQKWVEVGVSNFYIFTAERSWELVVSDGKKQRLQKIVVEAIEQSNRNTIPKIEFLDVLDSADIHGNNLLLHSVQDDSSQKLKDVEIDPNMPTNIFIWPEWGFSDSEVEIFKESNFKKFYLGDRILRTETAGIVVAFFISL